MKERATLSRAEERELSEREETITNNLQYFYEVGAALTGIRDGRLYRSTHRTFEGYCRARWGMGRAYANRMIGAAVVKENLAPVGAIPLKEAQVRPLLPLKPEQQREAWQKALATAPGGNVTARLVRGIVEEMIGHVAIKPVESEPVLLDQIKMLWRKAGQLERTRFLEWLFAEENIRMTKCGVEEVVEAQFRTMKATEVPQLPFYTCQA